MICSVQTSAFHWPGWTEARSSRCLCLGLKVKHCDKVFVVLFFLFLYFFLNIHIHVIDSSPWNVRVNAPQIMTCWGNPCVLSMWEVRLFTGFQTRRLRLSLDFFSFF